jgi:hypothetical protein
MAGELKLTIKLDYDKGSVDLDFPSTEFSVDVTSTLAHHGVQNIGTSEEAIELGGVAAGGYVLMVNRDATNYVEIREGTGIADLVRILPGEPALFRLTDTATAPFAVANSAGCDVEVFVIGL